MDKTANMRKQHRQNKPKEPIIQNSSKIEERKMIRICGF